MWVLGAVRDVGGWWQRLEVSGAAGGSDVIGKEANRAEKEKGRRECSGLADRGVREQGNFRKI